MSLDIEDNEFKNFPVVLCKYKTITGEEKEISGTRGDGLCSIWAVLNGWGLLGRKEFIKNNWSQKWSSKDAKNVKKFQISNIIELISENLIKFIELMGDNDDIEIEGYTLFKNICQNLLNQLLDWEKLSTINGHTHFQILSILLGCQIKVRILENGVGRLETYGADSLGGIIRITTTGSHYNFHCRNKNGNLKSFNKHWWGKQWGETSTSGVYPNMKLGTAEPITKNSNEYYGITIKSSKKKSKPQTRKRKKSPSKTKRKTQRKKISSIRIFNPGQTPQWAKDERQKKKAKEERDEAAREARAAKWRKEREKSAERKAKRRSTKSKRKSKRVKLISSRAKRAAIWRENLEKKAAATKIQALQRGRKTRKIQKKTTKPKTPSLSIPLTLLESPTSIKIHPVSKVKKTKKNSQQMKKLKKQTLKLPRLNSAQIRLIRKLKKASHLSQQKQIEKIPEMIRSKAPSRKKVSLKGKKAQSMAARAITHSAFQELLKSKLKNLPKKKTKAKTRKLASIPKKSRSNTIRRGRTLKKRLIPKPPPLYKQNKPSGIDVKASPTRFGKMGDYYTSSLDSSSDSSLSATSSYSPSSLSATSSYSPSSSSDISKSPASLSLSASKKSTGSLVRLPGNRSVWVREGISSYS